MLPVVILLLATGCGYPSVEPVNRELITSLRTALSARSEEWLAMNESIIESRHAENEMSAASYDAFKSIIAQARAGDWREAELAALAFQKDQRPHPEQIANVTRPGASSD